MNIKKSGGEGQNRSFGPQPILSPIGVSLVDMDQEGRKAKEKSHYLIQYTVLLDSNLGSGGSLRDRIVYFFFVLP